MACFHPVDVWRFTPVGRSLLKSSDSLVHFNKLRLHEEEKLLSAGLIEKFQVPCNKCVGCTIDRSKQWALRCVLEAKQHEKNCFITLTYNDEHLPVGGSLDFDALQRFFKRLRKKFSDERIRYYAVGEYGAKLARPHFHAILFGFDFDDKWLWSVSRGEKLFRSPSLESLWTSGYSTVGSVSFESCAYVARYCQKKLYGVSKDVQLKHYQGKVPENSRMSRRPGIANEFFRQYQSDIYPKDYITYKGVKYKPGRYFDMLYKKEHPDELLQLKVERMVRALEKVDDNSENRLVAREECAKRRVQKLIRGFEEGDSEVNE